MADIFTKEKRSWIMSRIRGKNTRIEKIFQAILRKNKIGFKKHFKILGNPDFIIPGEKIAIFIDGDFWHGYDYKKRRHKLPQYWKKKLRKNIERDKATNKELKKLGWKVIRIWEHEILRDPNKCVNKITNIKRDINSNLI